MILLNIFLLLFISSACLNKPNPIEKKTSSLISKEYKGNVSDLLKKNPNLISSHRLNLVKLSLIQKIIKSKNPLYKNKEAVLGLDVFTTFFQRIDALGFIFSKDEIEILLSSLPKEEKMFLTPPIFLFEQVKENGIKNILELEKISEIFLKEKFNFNSNLTFYLGPNPPKVKSNKDKIDHWFSYLSSLLTELATEKQYSLNEAIQNEKELKKELSIFIKNFIQLQKNILKDPEELMNIYLNSFLYTIDEFASYLPPVSNENFKRKMSLDNPSLGFSYRVDLNFLTITAVEEEFLGTNTKLKEGDKIYKAISKGITYSFSELDKLINLINNPPNQEITFFFKRDNKENFTTIEPRVKENNQKKIQYFIFKDKNDNLMAFIKIPQFYYTTKNHSDLIEAKLLNILFTLDALKVKGLILDLRDNPGGSFPAIFPILSYFIDENDIFQEQTINAVLVRKTAKPIFKYKEKLIVLVNETSASSSEIVAGVLQEQKRAIIVGAPSLGKGTIQEVIQLAGLIKEDPELIEFKDALGALKFTRSYFYKLSGKAYHNNGITPDILIQNIPSRIKPLRKLNLESLNPIKNHNKDIQNLEKLSQLSQQRQKSDLFNQLVKIKLEEESLIIQEDWAFSNLQTNYQIKNMRKKIDDNKSKLNNEFNLNILDVDKNDSSLIKKIKSDPVAQESINILKDYIYE